MLDFVGNTITPGCTVCYPVRRGSQMWLARITVTQVSEDGIKGYNSTGRRINVTNLKNCVVVTPPKEKKEAA